MKLFICRFKSIFAVAVLLATLQNSFAAGESAVDNGDGSVTLSGSGVTNLDLTTYDGSYSKIIFDGLNGYLLNSDQTIDADIEILGGGLTISNGYSNYSYTFNGDLSGSGSFSVTLHPALHFHFNGDNTAFSGNFDNTSGGTNTFFYFGNGTNGPTTGSVSGTGSISTQTNVTYNYSNDVTAANDISGSGGLVKEGAGILTLSGNLTYTGGDTVNGGSIVVPVIVHYVDSAAAGAGDGTSWADAFTTIDAAIAAASAEEEVWVKGGTDYVLSSSLAMKSGVAVYGGFDGTEESKDDRAITDRNGNGAVEDWEFASETVIDGDASVRVVDFTGADGATLSGFTIKNGNASGNGGGVLTADNATVRACVISGNTSTVSGNNDGGGGVSIAGSGVIVDGCFIYGNYSAKEAGGLHTDGGAGTIQRCLIVNNETPSGRYSAGVYLKPSAALLFTNNVVAMNFGGASGSAGIRTENTGNVTFVNTIVWGNKRATGVFSQTENRGTMYNVAIQGSTFGTDGVNLAGDNTADTGPNFMAPTTFWGRPGDATEETAVLNSNWQINYRSACFNTGTASVSGVMLPTVDLAGVEIPEHGSADIGAYEYAGPIPTVFYVDDDATGAADGSSWSDAFTTVEDALAAVVLPDDQVWVAAGSYSSSTAINAYVIPADVKVYGGFVGVESDVSERENILTDNKTTLTQTAGNSRVVFMTAGSTVDGFAITGGELTSSPDDGDTGGGGLATGGAGVYMQSNATLANSLVVNNTTPTGSNIVGGGICMQTGGTGITVESCYVINNQAKYGGGLGAGRNPNANVVNCVIANNSAVGGYGGGYATGTSTGAGTINFTNCTVVRNSTSSNAAGIMAASGANCNVRNSINWGNSNTTVSGTYINSALEGQSAGTNTVTLNSSNTDVAGPNFVSPSTEIGYQVAGAPVSDWSLTAGSVALIDAGDSALLPAGTDFDITGLTVRVIDASVDPGAFEYDPNTPAIGLELVQTGVELTWGVEEEIGVKEYQIVNAESGEVLEVIVANGSGSYSTILPEDVTASLVVVDNSGFEQTYNPVDGNVEVVTYDLVEGWNLITIVGHNADTSAINSAFWGWNGSAYEIVENPQPTKAVWIYSSKTVQVDVTVEKSDTEIELVPGWNMVGPVENCKIPEAANAVYGWNTVYEMIAGEQDTLVRGVGYWIFAL